MVEYLDYERFDLLSPTPIVSGSRVIILSDAWNNRWCHWGGSVVDGSPAVGGTLVDMPILL